MTKKKEEKEKTLETVSVRVIRNFTDENCLRKEGEVYNVSPKIAEQLKTAKLIKLEV